MLLWIVLSDGMASYLGKNSSAIADLLIKIQQQILISVCVKKVISMIKQGKQVHNLISPNMQVCAFKSSKELELTKHHFNNREEIENWKKKTRTHIYIYTPWIITVEGKPWFERGGEETGFRHFVG